MNATYHHLSTEEQAAAHQLWDDLVHSSGEAMTAQQQLVDAPHAIQQALITAIVQGLRSEQELQSLSNPFATKE